MPKKIILYTLLILILPGLAFSQVGAGNKAPEIQAESWINSEPISLSDLEGKVAVVEFWATWCGPCRQTIPHLNDLYSQYQQVTFISLTNEDREKSNIDSFVEEMQMQYPIGTGSNSFREYGVRGIPHAYVIGKDGTVVWKGHPLSDNFEQAIHKALQNSNS